MNEMKSNKVSLTVLLPKILFPETIVMQETSPI